MIPFAELCAVSNFSFLTGASHPEELAATARDLRLAGLGLADRNTLAGIVRAHSAAKEYGVRIALGARLVFRDGTPDLLVYPRDRAAYARLTRLLTLGARRAPKGECWLDLVDFLAQAEGLQPILASAPVTGAAPSAALRETLMRIRAACGEVWLAARFAFDGEDRRRLRQLREFVAETGARLLATTEPLHHAQQRRELSDVLACIREKTTLDAAGRLLAPNAERHLKPPAEIARLYADAPEAVAETLRFLDGLSFSLDEISYQYPDEAVAGFSSPQTALEAMTWRGAQRRYPDGVPERVRAALIHELGIISQLGFAPYFLTVADIVRFAREERGILCQGRGSAANSTVCYCLGITSVDPALFSLLFERFVSVERNEPPDIDVDFEHERREEAIQYVYQRYGRERAALAATLICYRSRSAIRETAKAFGFSEDRITALTRTQQWWSKGVTGEDLRSLGLDPEDPRLALCLKRIGELQGFPRHLSQHVGGFVITRDRLDDIVPIANAAMDDRTVIEWDKDDLDALRILKVDLLGLGMLTCLRKAFALVETHYPDWSAGADAAPQFWRQTASEEMHDPAWGDISLHVVPPPNGGGQEGGGPRMPSLDLDTLPKEDPAVYRMLHRADSVGVFQVESRAQMSMLPRLRPTCFYDLVIEVAIVRPGPIQGGMVHPYLKRRQGLEPVTYPSKELEEVLKRTLGVPLFQEQAMQIAIVAAGFTPGEADRLRRAMATFRRVGTIGQLKDKFINGMIANGYDPAFAEASFRQIEGFGEYGFPESHAASFALLVYASCWLKCHYPDVFAAALLNAQPMGFYAPAQIVRDAEEHGVEVRPVDINASHWDNALEPGRPAVERLHLRHSDMKGDIRSTHAVRLGFRQVKGLPEDALKRLVARRGAGFDSVRDVWLRGGLTPAVIEQLADADAFRSLGLGRREALWAARGLNRVGGQEDLPLFADHPADNPEPDVALPPLLMGQQVVEDYRTLGLSLKTHPLRLLRDHLAAKQVTPCERLSSLRNGAAVRVAGLVLVRQRPGTASGVIFMTLEDEGHIANIIVWPKVFERFRPQVLGARLCAVDGVVQSESGVVHVVARRLHDYSPLLAQLSATEFDNALARADEVRRPTPGDARQHPRNVRINLAPDGVEAVMPKGRNFH